MPELRNHTPHPVRVVLADGSALDLPPHAPTPRCTVVRVAAGALDTPHGPVPLTRTALAGEVTGLPGATDGVLLVVARGVVEACPDRPDLLFPDDLVRDADGRVVACRALGRIG